MSPEIVLGTLIVMAAGVVLWMARSEDKEKTQAAHQESESTSKENISDRIEPLSPEAAREWLDDFLVQQQDSEARSKN